MTGPPGASFPQVSDPPPAAPARTWRRPMRARGTDEEHRVATPLELFFDLCFVVAVAQGSSALHHGLAEDRLGDVLVGYPIVFFAIWWAWMNVTWFASAYDNDDVLFRLAVLVQIAGALILAAGVPRLFDDRDLGVVTLGYAVMRVALVSQWLRAAWGDPERRVTHRRYAVGVTACTAGWGLLLALPEGWRGAGVAVMIVAELSVPVWAERAGATTWHPHHITERYGLFTLIVLGESVLAATVAIQTALDAGESLGGLLEVASGGLLIVFSMWWLYFGKRGGHTGVTSMTSFVWGYGHLVVFASAAAVGAGMSVVVDQATHHAEITARAATVAVAIPVAMYLLSVWVLHAWRSPVRTATATGQRLDGLRFPVAAGLVLLATLTESVLAIGVVLTALVASTIVWPALDRDVEGQN
jgi:low temperature requirement protein LtrA